MIIRISYLITNMASIGASGWVTEIHQLYLLFSKQNVFVFCKQNLYVHVNDLHVLGICVKVILCGIFH